jgi:hypothetical protein
MAKLIGSRGIAVGIQVEIPVQAVAEFDNFRGSDDIHRRLWISDNIAG